MAIDFKKTAYPGATPAIWRGECKMLPGGFSMLQVFPPGMVIPRGVLAYANFTNLTSAIIKVAKVLTGGTTTKPRVQKGHCFQVADVLMKLGVTDKSPMIKSIDRSHTEYDAIELSSAITGLKADDFLQESTEYIAVDGETPAVPAVPKYVGNMIVGADLEINKSVNTLDLAYEAMVLIKVAYPIPADWLMENSPCLKTNPNILFINQ